MKKYFLMIMICSLSCISQAKIEKSQDRLLLLRQEIQMKMDEDLEFEVIGGMGFNYVQTEYAADCIRWRAGQEKIPLGEAKSMAIDLLTKRGIKDAKRLRISRKIENKDRKYISRKVRKVVDRVFDQADEEDVDD